MREDEWNHRHFRMDFEPGEGNRALRAAVRFPRVEFPRLPSRISQSVSHSDPINSVA